MLIHRQTCTKQNGNVSAQQAQTELDQKEAQIEELLRQLEMARLDQSASGTHIAELEREAALAVADPAGVASDPDSWC